MELLTRRQVFEKATKGVLGAAVAFATAYSSEIALVSLASGGALAMVGCTAIDELKTWIPIGLLAFDQLVSFINPVAGTALAVAVTTADALWNAVSTAIANYQNTTDPTTTVLDKIIAAMDALQGGLATVLGLTPAGLSAAVIKGIQLGFALLLATLKSIQGKLEPKVSAAAKSALKAPRNAAILAAIGTTAPAKNKSDFVKQWNAIMSSNGLPVVLK